MPVYSDVQCCDGRQWGWTRAGKLVKGQKHVSLSAYVICFILSSHAECSSSEHLLFLYSLPFYFLALSNSNGGKTNLITGSVFVGVRHQYWISVKGVSWLSWQMLLLSKKMVDACILLSNFLIFTHFIISLARPSKYERYSHIQISVSWFISSKSSLPSESEDGKGLCIGPCWWHSS